MDVSNSNNFSSKKLCILFNFLMEINPNTGTYNVTFEPEEFDALYAIIEERLTQLRANIKRHTGNMTEDEQDIRNYKTYDIFTRLGGIVE